MNYDEARDFIKTLYEEKRIILGLERVLRLMSLLGDPQKNYPCGIITGTNGKGSTSIWLSAILKAAGYRVGTNLSPHVKDITERFLVDLKQIDHDSFARITEICKNAISTKWKSGIEKPTFHELMTAMAFYLFNEEKVDFAIMEVGMGGRYDACNIVNNKLSIFTPIHYDHCRYLGDSLNAIALEKAQIMKAGGAAVSAPQCPQVKKILNDCAKKFGAHLDYLNLKKFTRIESKILEPVKFKYKFDGVTEDDISLGIIGNYQVYNAALAIHAAEKLSETGVVKDLEKRLTKDVIIQGLNNVASEHLPARLELIRRNPAIIIDGGHNAHGIKSLMNELKNRNTDSHITLILGFKEGKNYYDALPHIDTNVDRIIFTNFENRHGTNPLELKAELEKKYSGDAPPIETVDDPMDAIANALNGIGNSDKDIVAIAGSLYLAGEIKNKFADSTEIIN